MNLKLNSWRLLGALTALVMVAACGSTPTPATSKGTITVAGFNFPESSILADIYGQALAHDGYTVSYKLNLGTRPIVTTAIKAGQVDLYPGYAASELEFFNKGAGEATSDAAATTAKLNTYLQPLGLVALTPAPAMDANAFAVPQAIADKYHLTKLSDLTPIAGQLVFGAGPECPTYKFCLPGLESVYGLHFKAVKTLDTDGQLTRAAFKNGSIQVGLVFTTDPDLKSLGLVVLEDDKHLTAADNVVPIARQAVATAEVKAVLNSIDAKLTTPDLIALIDKVANQHLDAEAVATGWLQQHNYSS
ncbi:MAG: ABC transporter substrate-binding protein [Candidatus Dormibacteraeota bacterium]|nr:ABC transporter substrate-binding protein [Candidatus Dormibacteraeota bacterium]